MATIYKSVSSEADPDIYVRWWLEEADGEIRLRARAQEADNTGVDQTVLSLHPDGNANPQRIECDLLAEALGFRNLSEAL